MSGLSTVPMFRQVLSPSGTFESGAIVIEIGAGESTIEIDDLCKANNGTCYSFDMSEVKIDRILPRTSTVTFVFGKVMETIPEFVSDFHGAISLLFLDGAPSAIQTFIEFQLFKPFLNVGARVLIDNASFDEQPVIRGGKTLPCRKGKVIVPYLRAHPFWNVEAFPQFGGGMVMATLGDKPKYRDAAMEAGSAGLVDYLVENMPS